MARAAKASQPRSRLSAQVHRALREGALYIFGALALMLWYALFTYDPLDPGFGHVTTDTAVRTASFLRIHSLAAVEIGDDVEIGAATPIDRGTLAPTR